MKLASSAIILATLLVTSAVFAASPVAFALHNGDHSGHPTIDKTIPPQLNLNSKSRELTVTFDRAIVQGNVDPSEITIYDKRYRSSISLDNAKVTHDSDKKITITLSQSQANTVKSFDTNKDYVSVEGPDGKFTSKIENSVPFVVMKRAIWDDETYVYGKTTYFSLKIVDIVPLLPSEDSQKQIAALEAKNTKLSSDILDLQNEISTLEYQILLLSTTPSTILTEYAELQSKVKTLEAEKITLQNKITALSTAPNTLATENAQLQNKVTTLETQNANLQNKTATLEAEKITLQNKITALSTAPNTLATENAQLQNKVTTLETQNANLQNKTATLEAEKITLQNKITALSTAPNTLATENAQLQNKVTTLETQNANLQNKTATLEAEKSTLQSQITALQSQVTSLQSKITTLETENTNLKNNVIIPVVEDQQQPQNTTQNIPQQQPEPIPTPEIDPTLIEDVKYLASQTHHGNQHVDRWNRVLAAFGEIEHDNPMTAAEAEANTKKYSSPLWHQIADILKKLEAT